MWIFFSINTVGPSHLGIQSTVDQNSVCGLKQCIQSTVGFCGWECENTFFDLQFVKSGVGKLTVEVKIYTWIFDCAGMGAPNPGRSRVNCMCSTLTLLAAQACLHQHHLKHVSNALRYDVTRR